MDFRRESNGVESRPEADLHLAVAVHRLGLVAVELASDPATLPRDAQTLARIHRELDAFRRQRVAGRVAA